MAMAAFIEQRIEFNTHIIVEERIVLNFGQMGCDDIIPLLVQDLGSLTHSPGDGSEGQGTQGSEGDEGRDDSDGGRGDDGARIRERNVFAAQTRGTVTTADVTDIVGGTGGGNTVTAVASGGVSTADTTQVDKGGTESTQVADATTASGSSTADDTTGVDETARVQLTVATDASSVLTIANTTGISRSFVTTSGGDVGKLLDGDGFAVATILGQNGTQRTGNACARQATTASHRITLEAGRTVATRVITVNARAEIRGNCVTVAAVRIRTVSAALADVRGVDVLLTGGTGDVASEATDTVIDVSGVLRADGRWAVIARSTEVAVVLVIGLTSLNTRNTLARVSGVGRLVSRADTAARKTAGTVSNIDHFIVIGSAAVWCTRNTRKAVVNSSTGVVGLTGSGNADLTGQAVVQDSRGQVVAPVGVGRWTALRIGARDTAARVVGIDSPVTSADSLARITVDARITNVIPVHTVIRSAVRNRARNTTVTIGVRSV